VKHLITLRTQVQERQQYLHIMKTHPFINGLFLLLLYLFFSTASAAEIRVIADRTQVELNETFGLIFESNESVDDDPDFSPLERDFKILSQGTSSNISIINGNYTKSSQWKLSLMPLRVGKLTIPSISFGKDKSPRQQITISPVQKSTGKSGEPFISELIVSTDSTYLQSQIIVTQRMLSSRNINGYEFSKLTISGVDAAIEPLSEKVKQYQTTRGTTPYLVLEHKYAVYPQAAGKLIIEPSLASARIAINNRSSYDPFRSNTKTVRRSSEKKVIEIKNIPKSFRGKHWLPAIEVQLVEEFPENQTFRAGEPITRTLSLLADGQSASQLPNITMTDIKNLKQYPDKPVLNDSKRDDGITGVQQIKFALIPSQAGKYTLPGISIPWWNTRTGKMETAKIPARTFNVAPALTASGSATTPPQQTITTNEPSIKSNSTPAPALSHNIATTMPSADDDNSLLWKIISLLLTSGWAVTLFLFWKLKRNNNVTEVKPSTVQTSLKQANRQLKAACEKNDAQACKQALLNWGSTLFNDRSIHSLGALSKRLDKPLADKINTLNTQLYKSGTINWKCEELVELCHQFELSVTKQSNSKNSGNQLETLYR